MIHYYIIICYNIYFIVDEMYGMRRVAYFLFARMSGKIWQTGCTPLDTYEYYIIIWAVEP